MSLPLIKGFTLAKVKAAHNVDRERATFGQPDPIEVCERVVSSIPADVLRKARRILDPAIGCCGIARAVVKRMVNELDIPFFDAILRVHGVDTDLALVKKARRLGFINTVHADFITWQPNMQFDVIIGNPPFQNGGNSAFYTKFFAKLETLLVRGGYFSLISPSKAAAKFSKGYKELAKVGWNSVEYGVDSLFPNIEQPMAIYSGSTADLRKSRLEVIADDVTESFERDIVLPVQYVGWCKQFPDANATLTLSIFRKFFKSENKLKERFEVLDVAPDGPYVYLTTVAWRYHPARPKGGPYALLAQLNEHDQYMNGKFIRCETQKEAEQIQWLLSRSLAYRFIAAASCRAKFLPRVLLEETPIWEGITTDEELFKRLGFTEIEITYINHWNNETAGK
jgi:hypothetical protein